MTLDPREPVYSIGVVVRMVSLHAQTLRNYERWGLIKPGRMGGRVRLYSQADVERILEIKTGIETLGLNVAGVEVMIKLKTRIMELQDQVERLTVEVVTLRSGPRSLPGSVAGAPRRAASPRPPPVAKLRR